MGGGEGGKKGVGMSGLRMKEIMVTKKETENSLQVNENGWVDYGTVTDSSTNDLASWSEDDHEGGTQ